jgi:hypothetical protein
MTPSTARLMVRGDPLDQERTIRAIAAGVNYFDTAVQYGNGESEKESRPRPAKAQTRQRGRRVRLPTADFGHIAEQSLPELRPSGCSFRILSNRREQRLTTIALLICSQPHMPLMINDRRCGPREESFRGGLTVFPLGVTT